MQQRRISWEPGHCQCYQQALAQWTTKLLLLNIVFNYAGSADRKKKKHLIDKLLYKGIAETGFPETQFLKTLITRTKKL